MGADVKYFVTERTTFGAGLISGLDRRSMSPFKESAAKFLFFGVTIASGRDFAMLVALPGPHFWFSGSALFTIGSFALFAILGFAGIAHMSATYRRWMISGYVAALVLFVLGWWQSAQQEAASAQRDKQLGEVQSTLSTLQAALNKIANSAAVSLNQSADQIAAAVIAKMEPLQKQVESLSRRAPDEIYQDGFAIGRIGGMALNETKTMATFKVVTTNREINFSRELELQGVRLSCSSSSNGPSSVMSFGASQSFTYLNVTCNVIGPR